MISKREIFRKLVFWLLPLLLSGCALLPAKKEVAVKPPVEEGEKEAIQQLAMAEEAFKVGNLEAVNIALISECQANLSGL